MLDIKFLKRRAPDSKNESPNSLLLDIILSMIGLICSLSFNFAVKTGLVDERLIYVNGGVIVGILLAFLMTRINKSKGATSSRFWHSCVTLQLGWSCAIFVIDFFI